MGVHKNLAVRIACLLGLTLAGVVEAYCQGAPNSGLRRNPWECQDQKDGSKGNGRTQAIDRQGAFAISPAVTALSPGQTAQFELSNPRARTEINWSALFGTIDAHGKYTAPSGAESITDVVTATIKNRSRKIGSATVHVVQPGKVSPTANPQVALYSISPAGDGHVHVQFGPDTNFELKTWSRPIPECGGAVSIFVAGMRANATYHIRGVVEFEDGAQFLDSDEIFITGEPANPAPAVFSSVTTPGMTPQSGVELYTLAAPGSAVVIADLSGNVLWNFNLSQGAELYPAKLLPNGDFLLNYAVVDGSVMSEVDLAGNVVWQMTSAELYQKLQNAHCQGCGIYVEATHDDIEVLPNGHLIVITNTPRIINGHEIWGDALVDLDENREPVWVWDSFTHLDVNRHGYEHSDWTDTNAVIYSKDDGNLILSMRAQNWLIKINYANGKGDGTVFWRLGYQGDFSLLNSSTPADWFSGQYAPLFVSKNTTKQFTLALFDNGYIRVFPPGYDCSKAPCLYSRPLVLQIDEEAKTASIVFSSVAPRYSSWGGNTEVLLNDDVEYCVTDGGGYRGNVYEVLRDATAQLVWKTLVNGSNPYRAERLPSFYPGVQW